MTEQDELPDVFLKATICGNPIEGWHTRIPEGILKVEPLGTDEIQAMLDKKISTIKNPRKKAEKCMLMELKESLREPVSIYVFSIPIEAYVEIEKEVDLYRNREVKMGEFTKLVVPGEVKTVSLNLEKDHFYDVFGFSGTTFVGGGRFSTGTGEIAGAIILEEMKFFALKDLGVAIDQAEQVTAKVIPMTAWGTRGRFIIAGFRLGTQNEGNSDSHTIMVNHICGVSYSHSYPKEEFLRFFNK